MLAEIVAMSLGIVAVAGLVCGWLSMRIYGWLSPQERITATVAAAANIQRQMRDYDGDYQGMWVLSQQNLRLALKRVGYTLLPSIVAGFPVIIVMGLLSTIVTSPNATSPWTDPLNWVFLIAVSVSAIGAKWVLKIR